MLAVLGAHATYPLLAAVLVVFGAGVGVGLGTEVILLQAAVERRDLGIATSGVRFVEIPGHRGRRRRLCGGVRRQGG